MVSFVFPVRNDSERLRRCLATVAANRYPALEIVVVDNGSTDGSDAVARAAGARVLSLPGLPVSELRNQGARAATGEFLAFVDADHEIAPDWVQHAAEVLAGAARCAAVGALCEAPVDGTWVQRTYDLLRRRVPGIREVEWLGSGNMAVRRSAFEAVGGFDTTLETCEDVDLCRRLRARGFRIMQDSRLRNVHLGDPSTLTALFRGELWRGRDNLRASLRPPVTLRELPSIVVPVGSLVLFVIACAALATVSRVGNVVALLALSGVVAPSIARAARMLAHIERVRPLGLGQALAVAFVYDAARALALVRPGAHTARRGR